MTGSPVHVDARALRNALGCYATGVAVITTRDAGGQHVGVTVNSFASVSLDPPLVLFSLSRSANIVGSFSDAGSFGVSILSANQQQISNTFARPSSARLTDMRLVEGANGCALLAGALAHIECDKNATLDGGDHLIFVGLVTSFRTSESTEPLLFFRGAYGTYIRDRRGELPPANGTLTELTVSGWG